jgi:hypothetical protein
LFGSKIIDQPPGQKKPTIADRHTDPGSYPIQTVGKITFPALPVNTRLVVIFSAAQHFFYYSIKKELYCGLIKPHAYREKFSSWLSINQTNP